MQKSSFNGKIVIIIKVKRSKVKVIELPYFTFPVIVLNNKIPELVVRQCFEFNSVVVSLPCREANLSFLDLLK